MNNDLINLYFFEKSMEDVVTHMRKEMITSQASFDDTKDPTLKKFREKSDQEMQRQQRIDAEQFGSAQAQRMQNLKLRIISIFKERDITFFDCFQGVYDPLNDNQSIISITEFKKRIRQLNLPLSVQDHRLLRRIADPQ